MIGKNKKKQSEQTGMDKPYFQAEQMSVGYQRHLVVQDIEITLNQGEILTLIGPNGAGKSTVLKSIARQIEMLGGSIYLDQNELNRMSSQELSKKMAVVMTSKLCSEKMTCEDVVSTGRYPYTGRFGILSSDDKKVVKEAMDLVQVTQIKDLDFTRISDGQRQRVMLARAICQEPQILILDEPTSYLDVKYKLEFLSILQEMKHQKKLTVIMSLHELDLAERISDKILCVNGITPERFGTPQEIFTKGYISKLFGISSGSFDEKTMNAELPKPCGKPSVFVIAGNGTGRNIYRKLQRKNIPFATGILFENDLDYPVAKALATEVISTESFEPIKGKTLEVAKVTLSECDHIICCRPHFGTFEKANEELLSYAKQLGKIIK